MAIANAISSRDSAPIPRALHVRIEDLLTRVQALQDLRVWVTCGPVCFLLY